MNKLLSFAALFTSVGTLFCCALPALFVVLGAGATFAALTETVPAILILGEHKELVFVFGGLCLGLAWFGSTRTQPVECAIEGDGETACETTQRWTRPMLIVSSIMYALGAGVAYILPLIM